MSSPATKNAPRPSSASPSADKKASSKTRIGPYVLSKTLGQGSTGRVKLGIHQKTDQRVAVKIISKTQMQSAGGQEQQLARKIEREIVIMKLVQHPNVLSLLDVYEANDELYLVLEHVEGGELFDYLVKKGRLDEREACTFFQQIIFGLDYCHKHQICHRDLKPENLLLDSTRRIKIADFGMASLQQSGKMLETSCGSPHYASPEIIKGIKYDGASSDIWSCGVILYALLSGNLPFDDENIRRLLAKVKVGKFNMPSHISPSAQDLIARMLQVEPSDRIRMEHIVSHPWFNTVAPQSELIKPVSEVIRKHKPVNADSSLPLDDDILKSLNLIGWTDEDALRTALLSHAPHPEKIFYHLLHQRKVEYFDSYVEEGDEQTEDAGVPRRRAESMAAIMANKNRNKSESNLLVSDKSKRAALLAGGHNTGSARELITPGQLHIATRAVNASGQSGPATAGAGARSSPNSAVNDFRGRVQSQGECLDSKRNRDIVARIPDRKTAILAKTQQQNGSPHGSIQIATTMSGSSSVEGSENGTTTPRFHRKRPSLIKTDSQTSSTPTPSTPKWSWFANLFHFKPDAIIMVSDQNVHDTLATLRTLLNSADVKVQEGRRNGLKCKAETAEVEADMGIVVRKPTKFRIDVNEFKPSGQLGSGNNMSAVAPAPLVSACPDPSTMGCEIQFALQQGSMDAMALLVSGLTSVHLSRKA